MSKPKNWRTLNHKRKRKSDIAPRLPEIAKFIVDGIDELKRQNYSEQFNDNGYISYLMVDLVHGEFWRCMTRVVSVETAIIEIKSAHEQEKFQQRYKAHCEQAKNNDGVDRRQIQNRDTPVIEKGVNWRIENE